MLASSSHANRFWHCIFTHQCPAPENVVILPCVCLHKSRGSFPEPSCQNSHMSLISTKSHGHFPNQLSVRGMDFLLDWSGLTPVPGGRAGPQNHKRMQKKKEHKGKGTIFLIGLFKGRDNTDYLIFS